MKVLVIGSDGQLGLEFQNFSNSYNSLSWVFSTIKTLDLLKLDTISFFLNNINPSVIVNCAAYTNVDKAETESKLANTINYKAVDIISKWTNENNKKLIHVSTDYVFNGISKLPLYENSITNPVNEYGRSKLKGEQVCLKNDANSVVIRTSWLYSSFGKNFVKTMIILMKSKEEINVVNDQVGSPTSTRSLVALIFRIIGNKTASGIFHWSDGAEITWYDFAIEIQEQAFDKGILKSKIPIRPTETSAYPTLAKRPPYSTLDRGKTLEKFGADVMSWKEELKRVIDEIAKAG